MVVVVVGGGGGQAENKERGGLQSKQAQLGNKSTHFHQSFPCVFLCAEV